MEHRSALAGSRAALATLSVFAGSFSLDSAEEVLSATGTADTLGALEALVDASLIGTTDLQGVTMFRLLSLVRAYAAGLLSPEESSAATDAWLAHYRDLAVRARAGLRGRDQLLWIDSLERETENLAAVTRVLFARRDFATATEYWWTLFLYLWIGGYLGVVCGWAREMLEIVESEGIVLDDHSRAIADYYVFAVRFWQEPQFDVAPGLTLSRDLFREAGDVFGTALAGVSLGLALLSRPQPDFAAAIGELEASLAGFAEIGDDWGQAMALTVLGRVDMAAGDMSSARERFERALGHADAQGERLGIVVATNSRGWTRLLSGDAAGARDDFATALDLSLALHHDEGIAYGLESFVALRAGEGDVVAAGRLLGAAQRLRRAEGLPQSRSVRVLHALDRGSARRGPGRSSRRRGSGGARPELWPTVLQYVRD